MRLAEAPLLEELRSAGFQIESVWDLVNTTTSYTDALPVLLRHLRRSYPDRVREGIARALAVSESKFAWRELMELYEQETGDSGAKHGLAVALAIASDDAVIPDVISLARDPRHGESRVFLVAALARSRDARAQEVLCQLTDDPQLTKEVRLILRRRARSRHRNA